MAHAWSHPVAGRFESGDRLPSACRRAAIMRRTDKLDWASHPSLRRAIAFASAEEFAAPAWLLDGDIAVVCHGSTTSSRFLSVRITHAVDHMPKGIRQRTATSRHPASRRGGLRVWRVQHYASSARSATTCAGLTAIRAALSASTSHANCMIEPRAASRIIRSTSRAFPSIRYTLPPTTVISVVSDTYGPALPASTSDSTRAAGAARALVGHADY